MLTDEVYQNFVDSIGQGRVWSGENALDLGLIDEYGGLNRAIELAAEEAELADYRIRELPTQKDPIQKFFEDFFGASAHSRILETN